MRKSMKTLAATGILAAAALGAPAVFAAELSSGTPIPGAMSQPAQMMPNKSSTGSGMGAMGGGMTSSGMGGMAGSPEMMGSGGAMPMMQMMSQMTQMMATCNQMMRGMTKGAQGPVTMQNHLGRAPMREAETPTAHAPGGFPAASGEQDAGTHR